MDQTSLLSKLFCETQRAIPIQGKCRQMLRGYIGSGKWSIWERTVIRRIKPGTQIFNGINSIMCFFAVIFTWI